MEKFNIYKICYLIFQNVWWAFSDPNISSRRTIRSVDRSKIQLLTQPIMEAKHDKAVFNRLQVVLMLMTLA